MSSSRLTPKPPAEAKPRFEVRNRLRDWIRGVTGTPEPIPVRSPSPQRRPSAAPSGTSSSISRSSSKSRVYSDHAQYGGSNNGAGDAEPWEYVDDTAVGRGYPAGSGAQSQESSSFYLRVSSSMENLSNRLITGLFTAKPVSGDRNRQGAVPERVDVSNSRRMELQLQKWDSTLEQYPLLASMEQRTGLKKVQIATLAVSAFFFVVFLGFGMNVLTSLVGFTFPVYMSFKTLESPDELSVKIWLKYWVVYAFFCCLEPLGDRVLQWVPMYNLVKLLFLFWCFLPRYQGATVVYSQVVKPVLEPLSQNVEEASDTVREAASLTARKMKKHLRRKGKELGLQTHLAWLQNGPDKQ